MEVAMGAKSKRTASKQNRSPRKTGKKKPEVQSRPPGRNRKMIDDLVVQTSRRAEDEQNAVAQGMMALIEGVRRLWRGNKPDAAPERE